MSTLKIGIHLVPLGKPHRSGNSAIMREQQVVSTEAELLDIGQRFCRLRIARERYHFDPSEIGVQFAWSDMVARVIWTNTSDHHVEIGLLLPAEGDGL